MLFRSLEQVTWKNRQTGETEVKNIHHLYLMLGAVPNTQMLEDCLELDSKGFILTGPEAATRTWPLDRPPLMLETSIPGVFAAGDVRSGSIKRVATAVGEGAMAVNQIYLALEEYQKSGSFMDKMMIGSMRNNAAKALDLFK